MTVRSLLAMSVVAASTACTFTPDARWAIEEGRAVEDESPSPPVTRIEGGRATRLPDLWPEVRPGYGGSVWYRFEVPRPADDTHRWAVYLPRINMNAAVFVNGHWIGDGGRFEPPVAQNWNVPLYFPVATERFDRRINVVDVRVYAHAHDWGGLWSLYVGPADQLEPCYRARLEWQVGVARGASIIASLMAVVLLAVWIGRRQQTIYLLGALSGLAFVVNTLTGQFRELPVPFEAMRWLTHESFDWYAVLTAIGVQRRLHQRRPRIETLMWAVAIAGTVTTAVVPSRWFLDVATAFHVAALGMGYFAFVEVVRRYRRLPPIDAAVAIIGGIVVMLVTSHEVGIQLELLPADAPRLLDLVAPTILVGFGTMLATRFVRNARVTERMNVELEARVAEREAQLRENFERIAALDSARNVARERERLMREMHDGIGTQLVTALAVVDTDDVDLDLVSESLQDALQEMRVVVDSLDPDATEIPVALGQLRRRLEPRLSQRGLRFVWRVENVDTPEHVTQHDLLHIVRILQEAITNTLKHADAETIEVRATAMGEAIVIEIADDGRGFEIDRVEPGRGLLNIRRRAREMGATIEIDSKEGTRVRLTIPCTRSEAPDDRAE